MSKEVRDIKISQIEGKYKCISAYKIPERDLDEWLSCPNCGLKPLIWVFNNGRSTACGCGRNEYGHFSIRAESIMSYVTRNNGSALEYKSDGLKNNWNHWVLTGEIETHESLQLKGQW